MSRTSQKYSPYRKGYRIVITQVRAEPGFYYCMYSFKIYKETTLIEEGESDFVWGCKIKAKKIIKEREYLARIRAKQSAFKSKKVIEYWIKEKYE